MNSTNAALLPSDRTRPAPRSLRAVLLAGLGSLALLAGCGGDREAANPPTDANVAVGEGTGGTPALGTGTTGNPATGGSYGSEGAATPPVTGSSGQDSAIAGAVPGAVATSRDAIDVGGGTAAPNAATATPTVAGAPSASVGNAAGTSLAADVRMEARSDSRVAGTVQLRESEGRLVATVAITGLKANAEHGFHVHENGDCSAPDAASAGAHFNPGGHRHGRPGGSEYHAGDLPNLRADANGAARIELPLTGLTLAQGATSIVNRSLVVHRDPDDHASQPAGNSGPRIGCGVIRLTAADPGAARRDIGDAAVNRAGAAQTPATPTGGRPITPTTPTPEPR